MKVKYVLSVVVLFVIAVPIMTISGLFTNYLVNTVIRAWSVDGGNLQILSFLFSIFNVPPHVSELIGRIIVAELVLFGAILGTVMAANIVFTKYIPDIKIFNASMLFCSCISILILFFETGLGFILTVLGIINLFLIFYAAAKIIEKDYS